MAKVIGANCLIQWNDNQLISDAYISVEPYVETTNSTESGISDDKVFYYADSVEQLLAMVSVENDDNFTLIKIYDWVTDAD